MFSDNNDWEDLSQEINELRLENKEIKKTQFKFNFNAPPYEPQGSLVENSEDVPQKINQTSIQPKVTKKIEEQELNRNKVVAEATESKETINIVFIGHVDAGKSTIGGHLLFQTGMVDKRTLEKYEKEAKEKNRESWFFSWALDTNAEERDKGKTVEVGKAHFQTEHKRFVLLDAPGHRGYVPNMISGTAQADVAVLVISARKGEFETGFDKGGQTREHAQIAKISGVKYMIVVVNKMDDPTVNWCEERYKEINERLSTYLKKIGWKQSELYFMPISGYTGANLSNRISPEICNWWRDQPSFLEYLDNLPPINQDFTASPMIIISDKYKDMGTVCSGKVISGCFTKNDQFTVMPTQKTFRILNIMSLDDEEKNVAKAGENIKLRLMGADEVDTLSGYVLCHPNKLCPFGKIFDAHLVIIECKSIMTAGYRAIIHVHNVVDEATFVGIKKVFDRKTQKWSTTPQRFVKQDSICVVRLSLNNIQCIAPFSEIPYLGRFSLRDEGKTVALGKILKIIP